LVLANNTSLHRTPKASAVLPVGKILALERSHLKRNSFFAFAACELNVIRLKFVIAHWQMSQSQVLKYVAKN
jgi:hypothetical protein